VVTQQGRLIASDHGGVTLLELLGEHDAWTARQLDAQVYSQIERRRSIVISLEHAAFIDSVVIAALYGAEQRARDAALRMVLHVGDEAPVARVVGLAGLSDRVPCASRLEDAIAIAASGAA
jgi:anti-anti-sigma factor